MFESVCILSFVLHYCQSTLSSVCNFIIDVLFNSSRLDIVFQTRYILINNDKSKLTMSITMFNTISMCEFTELFIATLFNQSCESYNYYRYTANSHRYDIADKLITVHKWIDSHYEQHKCKCVLDRRKYPFWKLELYLY